jgi:glutamyl-tRNA(Gln) amidotransferase subunit D
MNLICAVTAAAKWNGAGVVSCMHGSMNDDYCNLIRGTKVRKMHTSRRDAFRPINDEPLARVYPDGKIESTNRDHRTRRDAKTFVGKLDENVAMVYVYPGMDPGIIEYHLKNNVKGLVIAATALGHVPTNNPKSLAPVLKKAVSSGVPVVIASQTLYGRVHPYVYTNLRKISMGVGAIYAEDMLPEVAYAKLMMILAETNDMNEIRSLMLTNMAGEISHRETDDCFLR